MSIFSLRLVSVFVVQRDGGMVEPERLFISAIICLFCSVMKS